MSLEFSLPAKVGAGASAAAAGSLAIAGGAGAFSSGATSLENETTTEKSKTNKEIEELKAQYAKGTIGNYFSYFFNPLTGENLEEIWNESFSKFEKKKVTPSNISPLFTKVEVPFSEEEDEKSLNWACKKSYESSFEEIKVVINENILDGIKMKFRDNIWEFCSQLNHPPLTFFETLDYLGNKEGLNEQHTSVKYKTELLGVEENFNDVYWSRKNEVFFSINEKEITGLYFKALRKDEEKKKNNLSLKDACMSFYKQELNNTTDSATQPKLDSFLDYCSWYTLY